MLSDRKDKIENETNDSIDQIVSMIVKAYSSTQKLEQTYKLRCSQLEQIKRSSNQLQKQIEGLSQIQNLLSSFDQQISCQQLPQFSNYGQVKNLSIPEQIVNQKQTYISVVLPNLQNLQKYLKQVQNIQLVQKYIQKSNKIKVDQIRYNEHINRLQEKLKNVDTIVNETLALIKNQRRNI